MMVIPKVGFLFDVDGTLTYYRGVDSVVDLLLVNDLEKIRKFNHPIWLVTGRSVKWVQEVFFEHLNKDLTSYMNVMGEYGLISNFQGKRKKRRLPKETTDTLQKVQDLSIELLCEARELECIVSEEKPDKRCLWIEPKEVMLTIRTLPFYGLTTELFLRILEPIIEEYKDKLNFASNPYAIDILPKGINKKIAVEKAIRLSDPNKEIDNWFAFGDSEADYEMGKTKKHSVTYYHVPRDVSPKAHNIIEKVLTGKLPEGSKLL
ncbi:MAG: HAD-IIB family hydrolase [Candidatus Heimdallarchaeota archaeon]